MQFDYFASSDLGKVAGLFLHVLYWGQIWICTCTLDQVELFSDHGLCSVEPGPDLTC